MEKRESLVERRGFATPLSLRGVPPFIVYLFALIGFVYLLNPSLGVFELLPDNLPIIGNLDEGGATLLIWYGLIEFVEGRKYRRAKREQDQQNARGRQ